MTGIFMKGIVMSAGFLEDAFSGHGCPDFLDQLYTAASKGRLKLGSIPGQLFITTLINFVKEYTNMWTYSKAVSNCGAALRLRFGSQAYEFLRGSMRQGQSRAAVCTSDTRCNVPLDSLASIERHIKATRIDKACTGIASPRTANHCEYDPPLLHSSACPHVLMLSVRMANVLSLSRFHSDKHEILQDFHQTSRTQCTQPQPSCAKNR
jgi:hypothetical protein